MRPIVAESGAAVGARARLVQSVGVYTLLGFAPMATSFVLVPAYLGYLSGAEYGIVTLVNVSQVFVALAIALGLDAAMARVYFNHPDDPGFHARLLGVILGLVLSAAAVAAVWLALSGPWLLRLLGQDPKLNEYAWLVLLGSVAQVYQSIVFLFFRNQERLKLAALAAVAPLIAATVGTYLGVATLSGGAFGAIAGKAAGFTLGLLPSLSLCLMTSGIAWDKTLVRSLLAYSLPVLIYSVLNHLLFQGDRILSGSWFDLEELGYYALASVLVTPLDVVLNAGAQAAAPRFYRALSEKDPTIGRRIGGYYDAMACVLAALAVMAILVVGPALEWIGAERWLESVRYVPLLSVGVLFRTRYVCFTTPIFFFSRTRALPGLAAVSLLLGFCVAWLATRWFGMVGIAVSVLAWKWCQAALARAYSRWAALETPTMLMNDWTVLPVLGYVTALYLSPEPIEALVRWGGGLLLMGGFLLSFQYCRRSALRE